MLNPDFFHAAVPARPMGRYAHIVMLRVTEGYAVFQTDGELNKARVSAGLADNRGMTRITLFKRKQTTPERLNGRELLRHFGLLSASEDENDEYSCIYNVKSCKRCPDCVTYGFAIGDGGSEKSKVYADTAFSLTDYAISHEAFTLNAPYEDGTMSERGEVTSRINQQDHVKPQTIFPAVLTTRDLTANLFAYVLQNVLRTTRYGATTTRGGTVRNHIVAIVLSDGEIFSNLLFTQRLYDALNLNPEQVEPVAVQEALAAAEQIVPVLLAEDNARDQQVLIGDTLAQFLDGLRTMDEDAVRGLLTGASQEAEAYYKANIAKVEKKKK
ncbi:MAG: type I-D CRISPR-associated protein Cas7/Csc2 [Anaerolineae bacterium]|nr:type I-D CRISPR-associated protein Cas7/Csc2 [Anaerolineae bacterium]